MVYSLPPLTGATAGLLNHQRYDPEIKTLHGTGFLEFLKVLVSIFTPWEPSFAVSPRRQWQRNTAPLTVASRSARKAIRNVIKTRNLGQLSGYSPWRQGLQCEGWLEFIWRIVVLKHQVILSWHMAHVSHVKCSYGLTWHPIIDWEGSKFKGWKQHLNILKPLASHSGL